VTIPDYETLMLPLLESIADGAEHRLRDVTQRLAPMATIGASVSTSTISGNARQSRSTRSFAAVGREQGTSRLARIRGGNAQRGIVDRMTNAL
jgi:restriction endonuclease Mrr